MELGGRLKLWILGVGCAGLGLGLVLGLSLSQVQAHAAEHAEDPWLARFCDKYRLSRVQEQQVRVIRRARERRQREIFAAHLENLSANAQAQIEAANQRADERIEAILDPEQRRLYRQDRQSGPEPEGARQPGAKNR